MPCWRMSDEVSVFHPSPFWCRTRSPLGNFLSPCHAADLAPTAEVGTSTDPSRSSTSPSHPLLTSAMPREQYTVNSRRQGAFVSGFLCRRPHVSRSQHLHIIRYNQAKMRFHAKKRNLHWKDYFKLYDQSKYQCRPLHSMYPACRSSLAHHAIITLSKAKYGGGAVIKALS